MTLTKDEHGVLLLSARESLNRLFDDNPKPMIDYKVYPRLSNNLGAFVTLRKKNMLRGCIGFITSDMTLFDTVCEAARLSAIEDPRFPPLMSNELPEIQIEISVLSKPVAVTNYSEIIIGKHGLILEETEGSGILLPQVAVENKMTIENFLCAICEKSGLDTFYWRKTVPNLKSFTADVFAEEKHGWITGEKD
jgi:AmmeMemoRadiSam system protein A